MKTTASNNKEIINALSVDLEGFVESNLESFTIPGKYINQSTEDQEIIANTNVLLELFSKLNLKATFFILGRIARDIPNLVKEIAHQGHEIACHGYFHNRVYSLGEKKFTSELGDAKKVLEDNTGKQVFGFRAPDFSITNNSLWAFDILKKLGFRYDSSIYPIGLHDVYGIADAKSHIHKMDNGLIEFPLAMTSFIGKRLPFGGGGYFRIYPLLLTKYFLKKSNNENQPAMFYIHPYEMGPKIPKIRELSLIRKFRHYHNVSKGIDRFKKLVQQFRFTPVKDILIQEGYLSERSRNV